MLVSFTQTYGTGRNELIDIHFKDKKLIELKNYFDLNIYSFHNCEQNTIDKFKELNKDIIKNVKILKFNNINYTETIKQLKKYLKEIKCTHFFFSQDDTFSAIDNKDVDWEELIEYVKEYKKDLMLNLYNKNNILNIYGLSESKKTFNVYKSTTLDFYNSDKTPWTMDDSPYICTIDMLDELYDDEYFSYNDIWEAEEYLREKYNKKQINRFITNKKMFQNYNIIGKTTYLENIYRKILKTNGLL